MNAVSSDTELVNEEIFDLLHSYKNTYKELHHKNTSDFFDSLVEKSKVDVKQNRETNRQIRETNLKLVEIISNIKKRTVLNVLVLIMMVVAIFSVFGAFYAMATSGPGVYQILIVLAGGALIALSIFLIVKLRKKIKELKAERDSLDAKINELIALAWEQMRPLNDLFSPKMSVILFCKTFPLIKIDKMFDRKRLDYLTSKFGLDEIGDNNRSTLYVQSGEINGNPFYICNELVHELRTKTYTGSITIHWTTTRFSLGRRVIKHHTQVLTASVEKPCPYYNEQPYLVYGNEAAPDLIFSRQDSDAEHMKQKQIDKQVNKEIKRLNKLSEKSISKGGGFTVLGNSEFEALFGATNRNNEVQFRLLFTPLAQKQLLQLMKEKEIGFGDDFDFIKQKMINIIYPEHLRNLALNIPVNYFCSFDFEAVKNKFISYNNDYFRYIFFAFAPLLAIPLYHQQKPHEYIYGDLYDSYVSFFEHEYVANSFDINALKHPQSVTPNILKTSVINSGDNCDTVSVTALGYRTEERVDYITKLGGDGRYHTIPVQWTEYIPVSRESDIAINILDDEDETTYAEKYQRVIEDTLAKHDVEQKDVFRVGLFHAYMLRK